MSLKPYLVTCPLRSAPDFLFGPLHAGDFAKGVDVRTLFVHDGELLEQDLLAVTFRNRDSGTRCGTPMRLAFCLTLWRNDHPLR